MLAHIEIERRELVRALANGQITQPEFLARNRELMADLERDIHGVYQHKILFRYLDCFTVTADGLHCKGRFYPWQEIKTVTRVDGISVIRFVPGGFRVVMSRYFRKQGEPGKWYSRKTSESFLRVRFYINRQIRESNRPPEYIRLKREVEELTARLDYAQDDAEAERLARKATGTLFRLQEITAAEDSELRRQLRKARINALLATAVSIFVFGSLFALALLNR